MLKIVPMTDEKVFNQMNCFATDGDSGNPVKPQAILPDLNNFYMKGEDTINGQSCQKWQKKEIIGHKVNKYTMWVKMEGNVAIPVHYEMKGYNNLLGSHYDHYFLEYMVCSI